MAPMTEPRVNFVVERASPRLAGARELIEELDAYLNRLYAAERNYLLDIEALCAPEIAFFVARVAGEIAACGALRRLDDQSAELKRMYVRPPFRGRGLGRAILLALEAHAQEAGVRRLVLETGVDQPEALALYQRHGFVRCARYGEYREDPTSVFFEKRL
jgi:putative acetyltransferase